MTPTSQLSTGAFDVRERTITAGTEDERGDQTRNEQEQDRPASETKGFAPFPSTSDLPALSALQ
jgi:hypothetical protein